MDEKNREPRCEPARLTESDVQRIVRGVLEHRAEQTAQAIFGVVGVISIAIIILSFLFVLFLCTAPHARKRIAESLTAKSKLQVMQEEIDNKLEWLEGQVIQNRDDVRIGHDRWSELSVRVDRIANKPQEVVQ